MGKTISTLSRPRSAGTRISISNSCDAGSGIATRYVIGASVVTPSGMAGQDSADRLCCVSVDLDAIACYYRIHALPGAPPEPARFAILRRCLPRFAELFARHGVRATFFVVGADLEDDAEGRAALAALARDGHELASHTHTHPYDFIRLGAGAIADEIDRAHAAIGACAGTPPVGFRAPGYEISAEAIEALQARGYRYDSSVFPSARVLRREGGGDGRDARRRTRIGQRARQPARAARAARAVPPGAGRAVSRGRRRDPRAADRRHAASRACPSSAQA